MNYKYLLILIVCIISIPLVQGLNDTTNITNVTNQTIINISNVSNLPHEEFYGDVTYSNKTKVMAGSKIEAINQDGKVIGTFIMTETGSYGDSYASAQRLMVYGETENDFITFYVNNVKSFKSIKYMSSQSKRADIVVPFSLQSNTNTTITVTPTVGITPTPIQMITPVPTPIQMITSVPTPVVTVCPVVTPEQIRVIETHIINLTPDEKMVYNQRYEADIQFVKNSVIIGGGLIVGLYILSVIIRGIRRNND